MTQNSKSPKRKISPKLKKILGLVYFLIIVTIVYNYISTSKENKGNMVLEIYPKAISNTTFNDTISDTIYLNNIRISQVSKYIYDTIIHAQSYYDSKLLERKEILNSKLTGVHEIWQNGYLQASSIYQNGTRLETSYYSMGMKDYRDKIKNDTIYRAYLDKEQKPFIEYSLLYETLNDTSTITNIPLNLIGEYYTDIETSENYHMIITEKKISLHKNRELLTTFHLEGFTYPNKLLYQNQYNNTIFVSTFTNNQLGIILPNQQEKKSNFLFKRLSK